jgi:N-methylhydantoinase B
MVMDFSRSSPACAGPVNISRATTIAACYVALKHIFGDVPANAGVLEPVEFRIDDGQPPCCLFVHRNRWVATPRPSFA